MHLEVQLAINNFVGYDNHINDLFPDISKKDIKFLTIEKVSQEVFSSNENIDFRLHLSLSSQKYLHERRSGTILKWLSDVGGLNDAL